MRHTLVLYGNITVGGLYVLPASATREVGRRHFVSASEHRIARHLILSISIEGADSEAPTYVRPQSLDINIHLHLLEPVYVDDDLVD